MEDLQTARASMEQKTQRKRELINQLKGMNAKLIELREELNKHGPSSAPARRTPTQRLIEKAEHMEFVIGTSAYTPAQERAMLKELKLVQAQIGTATAEAKVSDQVRELRGKLRAQLDERSVVQKELDTLRSELEAIYQVILKAGAERAAQYAQHEQSRSSSGERTARNSERGPRRESREHRRPSGAGGAPSGRGDARGGHRPSFNDARRQEREQERAEMAPYLKDSHDPYVSLEEIVIIKKKPSPPSSD